MKRIAILGISLVLLFGVSACEDMFNNSTRCKVSTTVSSSFLTFSNQGGEELVDVNPKPYYIIQRVQVGEVGESGYMYEEKVVEGYSTSNYAVQKTGDGRLLIRTQPYYGSKPFKFEVEVKGGDCSKTIHCTIQP